MFFFNEKIFFTPTCCSFCYSDALDLEVSRLCGDAQFSCCDCFLLFLFWVCASDHVPGPGALSGSDFHFPALFLVLILAAYSISCLPVPFGFLQVEASAYFGQICSLGSTSVLLRASAPPWFFFCFLHWISQG
jgi:hypothetical protein